MLDSEAEATNKWCPQVRFVVDADGEMWPNRPKLFSRNHCLGSKCMAWRWGGKETLSWRDPEGQVHWAMTLSQVKEFEKAEAERGWQKLGRCGLAGLP